jgi:hypothetical protein
VAPERFRCAVESRDAGEPLHGTASRVRRWMLVEQRGPWGREALTESRLDAEIGMTLRSAGRRLGVRVLLIRRAGWRAAPEGLRRVYLVHTGVERSWIEQLDLDDADALTRIDLGALAEPDPPGVGAPGPANVHLVCTNGRHDACCADFGRPVIRALVEAGTDEVWESSHVGGDRFAANVVCLPHGLYFGRVEPDEAARLLGDCDAGIIHLDRYRGRSCYPPLVQSAELFARRELDERRLHGLTLDEARRDGPDRVVARYRSHDTMVRVAVTREPGEETNLTCSAVAPARPWRYLLESIDRTPLA